MKQTTHHPMHQHTTGSSGSTSHADAASGKGAALMRAAAAPSKRMMGLSAGAPALLLPLLPLFALPPLPPPLLLLLFRKPPQRGCESA